MRSSPHRIPTFVLTLASLFALAAPVAVLAGEGEDPAANPPKAPASDPVRAAWDAFKAAQGEIQEARKAKDRARIETAGNAARSAQKEFGDLFAKSDWNVWDVEKDAELLTTGLMLTANTSLTAGDAKTAIRALETFLSKLPGSNNASAVRSRMLPAAYLKAGDVPKATSLWEKGAEDADPMTKAHCLVALGDLRCAQGDAENARVAWKKVAEIPSDAAAKRDPLAGPKSDAELRLALVGNAAPEIDSKVWLGGEAKALSAHKGQVVIVDFWATWCPPCRAVMPGLNAMYEKHKAEGLTVLGVTRFYANGFIPTPGTKDPLSDGERVEGLTAEAFPAHIETFRKNLAITYPFVTATEAEFTAYKVRGIPTMAVIGRDGKVVFVKVGGGDETLLEMAVASALGGGGPTK